VPGDRASFVTVLVAGLANLLIAVAKLVGGLVSGSSALLSEAAHSVADTLNQAFLLTALHRSAKQPTPEHPFGYGMERYFWSLLAAVAVFVLGAGFSVLQGVEGLLHPREQHSVVVAYVVLALAFVFEGVSIARALAQARRDHGDDLADALRLDSDPTVRAFLLEDFSALLCVLLDS
jgi:cation diffusion facilitator family transporter